MQLYLPIAELPVNIFLILGLGGLGGVLAGMFGIGGGFLLTPLLIFIGVPPPVAVATSTCQIIASSLSGLLAHWRRDNVDVRMGLFLLAGGLIGAFSGVGLFAWLKELGQIDLAISLSYVIFLGFVGLIMGVESARAIAHKKKHGTAPPQKPRRRRRLRELPLPWQVEFPRSKLRLSAILPVIIGLLAGVLMSLMGIGGGFLMIPAMIYLLGMPASVVVGTSLFQIVFSTSLTTVLQAVSTQSVDIVLALILILGGVIGAQAGTKIGARIPAEKLRGLLALMVLAVCFRLGVDLLIAPENLYSVTEIK